MGTNYLQGKRIVVTGGAGFLGKAVCRQLQKEAPAAVVVPRSAEYDLRQQQDIQRLLHDSQAEIVFHLAAVVGGIGANRKYPGRFFYDNAMMGIQLMEECRKFGIEKYLQVGTICSYPKHTPVPFREEDLWIGYPEETNAAYGLAKKMLLVQAQAYRQQYNFHAVTLLPVNLYGPHDCFDLENSHVIPALIRKVLEAKEQGKSHITVWGTGSASREFLYVDDAAEGIVLAAARYDGAEPINLGTQSEITIRELVALICELCEFQGLIHWDTNRPDGQPRRCLDVSRAERELGFRASTSLREGLQQTIRWYQAYRRQFGYVRAG